jgi:hypothetical protein
MDVNEHEGLSNTTLQIKVKQQRLFILLFYIRVITKLPNSEQSYKGKVKTHKYINRQNQSTTGKL